MEIADGLKKHNKLEKASFHMPGHKRGQAYAGTELYNDIFRLDTTEVYGTDCLLEPSEMILRAEKKCAEAYHSAKSFFLVNGSTCGILAMFEACFCDGDKVLVDRNCHTSVINAMAICGVVPYYVSPEFDDRLGIPSEIKPEIINEILEKESGIKGVFITCPNYYGKVSNLSEIAEISHRHNAVLLVDEAHAAHFPFSPLLPKTAMECGADISVMSLHKTLPSFNQTAVLHIKSKLISEKQLKEAINMFQTTSPSYVLLAYSEAAIEFAAKNGEVLTADISKKLTGFTHTEDLYKLLINKKGYSGYELNEILRSKFGIYAELADYKNVLLMPSYGTNDDDIELLKAARRYIDSLPQREEIPYTYNKLADGFCAVAPRKALKADRIQVDIKKSLGRISGRTYTVFPPCIPILIQGEQITKEHILRLSKETENVEVINKVNI